MTYAQTITLFETIAASVNPTGTFIHGRRTDGSLAYPEAMPQIHLYPFIVTPDLVDGNDQANIVMGFWKQGAAEASQDENKSYLSDMDVIARAFLNELNNTTGVNLSSIRMETGYNLFPAVLTGWTVTFTLISKTSTC